MDENRLPVVPSNLPLEAEADRDVVVIRGAGGAKLVLTAEAASKSLPRLLQAVVRAKTNRLRILPGS